MFIADLDRPWSETPFLFQGFEVRNQKEIEELRRLTEYVYILAREDEIEFHLSASTSASAPPSSMSEVLKAGNRETTVSAEEEILAARESHERITQLLPEVESIVRAGNPIAFELFERPVALMVDSISKNPDAFIWLTYIKKFDS